ncbi:conjugal transfer protein [Mycobacteroides abscessus]|uniref:conjugal transfer protein n=1 Tax=Mycobacteroides abscessus TaxID=36809 RepID=UPI002103E80A|nr:conjugal transfer protein [Mycobacteroides abscessus]
MANSTLTSDQRMHKAITLRNRLTNYLIYALVVLAAISGLDTLRQAGGWIVGIVSTTTASDNKPIDTSATNSYAVATDYAQEIVMAFLTTPKERQEDLRRYYTGDPQLPEKPIGASDPHIAGVAEHAGRAPNIQEWAIIVSVAQPDPTGGLQPIRVRYAATLTVIDGKRGRATARPKPLPEEDLGVDMPLDYETTVDDNDPAVVAITGFLRALLTGGPDLSLYKTGSYKIKPFSPPLFQSIRLTSVRSQPPTVEGGQQQVRMFVTVVATRSFSTQTYDYPLRLTVTNDRWEVAAIEQFPALAPKVTEPKSASTTTTSAPDAPSSGHNTVFGKP